MSFDLVCLRGTPARLCPAREERGEPGLPRYERAVTEFFAANLVFVYLIYGLAFLSMGLVLSVLVRSPLLSPSLRSLWMVAGFGLLHGLAEWADMAVLIKEQAGDPGAAMLFEAIGL